MKWLINKTVSFILAILMVIPFGLDAQNCDYHIHGRISDQKTGLPIDSVEIRVDGKLFPVAFSDDTGFFRIGNLCEGTLEISFIHSDYQPDDLQVNLKKEHNLIKIKLKKAKEFETETVTVSAIRAIDLSSETLNSSEATAQAGKPLARMLEEIPGVSSITNGYQIAKPVVHGLYGNRLGMVQAGAPQAGQRWGNDHGPAINPLASSRTKVVKGAASLSYPGTHLGAMVVIEPERVPMRKGLHGKVLLLGESNGRQYGSHLSLHQRKGTIAWRVEGTFKRGGDRNTPDYFLRNTGNREAHGNAYFEKIWSDRAVSKLWFSTYNAELGVLRGSHISNLTDLEGAIGRDIPFFTEENFRADITSPYQQVNHHMLSLQHSVVTDRGHWFKYNFSLQLNYRKEFDVRRGGRSEAPALSLDQQTYFGEISWKKRLGTKRLTNLHSGIQYSLTNNTNNPETGIFPLIPDYLSNEATAFSILKGGKKWRYELGARYSYLNQLVLAFTRSLPIEVIRYQNNFHNINSMASLSFHSNKSWNIQAEAAYATRNPAINELYSFGLHQGVSGIEEGNPDLQLERSIKSSLSIEFRPSRKLQIKTLAYIQHINNYIFLQPESEYRLTIRGAFPVFSYQQTDGVIMGWDGKTSLSIGKHMAWNASWSLLRGQDISNELPLVFMPPNRLQSEIRMHGERLGKLLLPNFAIGSRYVFRQNRLTVEQDFLAPPPAYFLSHIRAGAGMKFKDVRLRIELEISNLFNIRYRDYLDRQRYFRDNLGRNYSLGIRLFF